MRRIATSCHWSYYLKIVVLTKLRMISAYQNRHKDAMSKKSRLIIIYYQPNLGRFQSVFNVELEDKLAKWRKISQTVWNLQDGSSIIREDGKACDTCVYTVGLQYILVADWSTDWWRVMQMLSCANGATFLAAFQVLLDSNLITASGDITLLCICTVSCLET